MILVGDARPAKKLDKFIRFSGINYFNIFQVVLYVPT